VHLSGWYTETGYVRGDKDPALYRGWRWEVKVKENQTELFRYFVSLSNRWNTLCASFRWSQLLHVVAIDRQHLSFPSLAAFWVTDRHSASLCLPCTRQQGVQSEPTPLLAWIRIVACFVPRFGVLTTRWWYQPSGTTPCRVSYRCHSTQRNVPVEPESSVGHMVAPLVGALPYNPEGREFDSWWCHWNFSLTLSFRSQYGPGVDSVSNRNDVWQHVAA
jgi:hypothetical protein